MGSVRLFKTADASVLATQEGHETQIHAVAASPLGDLVASASDDGQVRLWKAATLEAVRAWSAGGRYVGALAFSKDGRTLYVGRKDGSIHRVSVETGEQQQTPLKAHTRTVRSLSLDRSGETLVSAAADGKILWWDLAKAVVRHSVAGEPDEMYEARLHREGTWVASCGKSGTVRLWQRGKADPVASFEAATTPLFALAWHPRKPRLAWSGDRGRAGILRVVEVAEDVPEAKAAPTR